MRILGSILLSCCLLISVTSHAQVSLGIKAGASFARIHNAVEGNDGSGSIALLSTGTVTGLYGGLFVDIPLDSTSKLFYLRPGVEYVGAGGNLNSQGNYYNPNGFVAGTKYTLHYADVPVQFVFSPSFAWGRPWIGIGPYAGVLLSGTANTQGSGSEPVAIGNNANDNFQRFDFGYAYTMGLTTKGGFLFGIDYQHSLIRTEPTTRIQPSLTRLQTRNSVWGIYIGWMFKL